MAGILASIAREALSALFPRRCVRCGDEGGLLCRWCSSSVDLGSLPFAYANPVVRELLRSWKYYGDASAWEILRTKATAAFDARGVSADAIVPIPLVGYRERYRGFNQARDIGIWVSRETDMPVTECLGRRFAWGVQAKRSREWRKLAMEISPEARCPDVFSWSTTW